MGTNNILRNGSHQAVLLAERDQFPDHVQKVTVHVEGDKRILAPINGDEDGSEQCITLVDDNTDT